MIFLLFIRLLATCSADHTVKLWDTTPAFQPSSFASSSFNKPPAGILGGISENGGVGQGIAGTHKPGEFVLDKTLTSQGNQRFCWLLIFYVYFLDGFGIVVFLLILLIWLLVFFYLFFNSIKIHSFI